MLISRVIGFPVWILWGVRISLRKKIALAAIFSLVGFTVVATILRGALLSEVFEQTEKGTKTFNIPWVWFWFHVELCTGKQHELPYPRSFTDPAAVAYDLRQKTDSY
jgi:hypothetical protein